MLPKIVIDARMVGPQPHGIARYVTDLACGLAEKKSLTYEPIFIISPDLQKNYPWNKVQTVSVKAKFLSLREWWEIPYVLLKVHAKFYHSTSFASLPWCPCPWIITVHDLNHLCFGSFFKKVYYRLLLKPFVLRAKKLCTVSEFSRKELSLWTGIPANKITVAYNAITLGISQKLEADAADILQKYEVSKHKYFFCLQHGKIHKNTNFIFNVHAKLRKQNPDAWPLLVAKDVSDQDLQILIANAGVVLCPSLYEGFGRLPLEALVLGAPVLASDIPSHREVLQNTNINHLLDPENAMAWLQAMQEIQAGSASRTDPEVKSAILEKYSVQKLVAIMDQVYTQLIIM